MLTNPCAVPGCDRIAAVPAVVCDTHTARTDRQLLCQMRQAWRAANFAELDRLQAAQLRELTDQAAEESVALTLFGLDELTLADV